MKTLGNLKPASGSIKNKKRKGRGIGSGNGKTSGKGQKGQKARKGRNVAPGFEGGQTPLYRRLPKRGFTNIHRKEYETVHLDRLNSLSGKVGLEELEQQKLIRSKNVLVKILNRGEFNQKIDLVVHKISRNAAKAVESAGGSVQIIEKSQKES